MLEWGLESLKEKMYVSPYYKETKSAFRKKALLMKHETLLRPTDSASGKRILWQFAYMFLGTISGWRDCWTSSPWKRRLIGPRWWLACSTGCLTLWASSLRLITSNTLSPKAWVLSQGQAKPSSRNPAWESRRKMLLGLWLLHRTLHDKALCAPT